MTKYILALDQGTTPAGRSSSAATAASVAQAQEEFAQILPGPGLVEHDPEAIWAIAARRGPAGAGRGRRSPRPTSPPSA